MKNSEQLLLEACCEVVTTHEKRWNRLTWMILAQAIVNVLLALKIKGIL